MSNTYSDPVKKVSRDKLRNFIASNMGFIRPRDMKVVCFPGAEKEGEEAIEVKEVYDSLGIPRQNIVGLEFDKTRAERLRRANLGIQVVESTDLDFFKDNRESFHVISLDYLGHKNRDEWDTIYQIAGNRSLYGNGILATNHSARRESKQYQLTLYFMKGMFESDKNEKRDFALDFATKLFEGKKLEEIIDLPLEVIRDGLTGRTLQIMNMGKSALFPIKVLEAHPYHQQGMKTLKKMQEDMSEEDKAKQLLLRKFIHENNFNLKTNVENGFYDKLCRQYRFTQGHWLKNHITQAGIYPDVAELLVESLIDTEMQRYIVRNMERYSYTSNKNMTMHLDLIAFSDLSKVYRPLEDLFSYSQALQKVTLKTNDDKKAVEIVNRVIRDRNRLMKVNENLPQRVDLGSSWRSKPRLSRKNALELLDAGFSSVEIAQNYSGFSAEQLAGMKAWITIRKNKSQQKAA